MSHWTWLRSWETSPLGPLTCTFLALIVTVISSGMARYSSLRMTLMLSLYPYSSFINPH